MFSSIKKLLGKESGKPTGVVTTNLDGLSEEEQEVAIRMLTKSSGIPQHKGYAEHGYSLAAVANPAQCPRCAAATELRYADFIYATQKGARLMRAPAGYFCTRCPTVVVDEELLRQGVSKGFVYRSAIGVEGKGKESGGPFRTWNGKEMIVFLDQVEGTMELIPEGMLPPLAQSPPATAKQKSEKELRRRALARQSRKRNRRK